MKHVTIVSKDMPAKANILLWPAQVKGGGNKQAYIDSLSAAGNDSLDADDITDRPFFPAL